MGFYDTGQKTGYATMNPEIYYHIAPSKRKVRDSLVRYEVAVKILQRIVQEKLSEEPEVLQELSVTGLLVKSKRCEVTGKDPSKVSVQIPIAQLLEVFVELEDARDRLQRKTDTETEKYVTRFEDRVIEERSRDRPDRLGTLRGGTNEG